MPRNDIKPDPQKQLMIKTKACQRLIKESIYYRDEVLENESQLQKMKCDNRDPYDIKKFEEVLSESHMMVPDSVFRRDKAIADLQIFLATLDKEGITEELLSSSWMAEAKKILVESGIAEPPCNCKGEDIIETSVTDLNDGEAF